MKQFVKINGTSYLIDTKKAIQNGCLKPFEKPELGQVWCIETVSGGRTYCNHYLLSHVRYSGVFLVNVSNGINWTEPVPVKNLQNISDDEWKAITGEQNFELLGKIDTFKIDNNTFSASR